MRPRSAMKDYQEESARLAVERRRLLLLLAPGDGKTVVALTALRDAGALPALVVAPAMVVETNVWGEEARAWEHLADLRVIPLIGSPIQRRCAFDRPADVMTVSYENLSWLTDECDIEKEFAAIIFDEVSKMKHAGTHRFKRARSRHGGFGVPFRLGLTGSPVGNHLLDLWGEVYMTAGPEPLGPTFTGYRDSWFEPYDHYGRLWGLQGMKRVGGRRGQPLRLVPTPTSRRLERRIHERVRPWAYARPTAERPGVPPVREVVRRLPLPPSAEHAMAELRAQLWTKLPSGAELEVLSRSAAAIKVRQLAGGAVYVKLGEHVPGAVLTIGAEPWEAVHDAKVRALVDLADELQGEPLLLYYEFRHERERIAAALEGRAVGFLDDAAAVREFCDRQLDVLVAHPQSGGMGLNLQAGGHHVAWFTLPWARWEYDQGCGRLARLGQAVPEVTSHLLLCGPVDEDVAAVLGAKGATERRFVEAMR